MADALPDTLTADDADPADAADTDLPDADDAAPPDDGGDATPPDDAGDATPPDDADDATPPDDADAATDADAGPPPTLSIGDLTIDEGTGKTTTATFTVSLSEPAKTVVTVAFATADGTATTAASAVGGSDYTAATGTLTFNPGDTSQTISVTIAGDATDEDDEHFAVALSKPTAATIARSTATARIGDDDAEPTLSIATASATEGNAGTTAISPIVSLSSASAKTVTVLYATSDGGPAGPTVATAGVDYTAVAATTLTFAPGETSKPAPISIVGDATIESDETFSVELSSPANATVTSSQATVTILNDDVSAALPTIAIATPAALVEGGSGTKTLSFTVTVSGARTSDVTVAYATSDLTATTAGTSVTGGADYLAASGTLTFTAAESTKTIDVVVNGDGTWEPDETFDVTLSGATGATATTAKATGTIGNDDATPTVTIGDAAVNEGASGSVASVFTATLSGPSSQKVTVAYATADGVGANGAISGGAAATGGLDYQTATGTLTFDPGATVATAQVYVNGDTLDEASETYSLKLSSPTNATLAAKSTGSGTITNDDTSPVLSIGDASVLEGSSGTAFLAFPVNLSGPSGRTVTVNFATSDGTAKLADNDYLAANGVLTFAPGETAPKAITVPVKGDTIAEPSESLSLTLSAPLGATISGAGVGVGTITNDDGAVTFINVSDAMVTEGNAGNTTLTFAVTLSAPVPAGKTLTVGYATAPYTANPYSAATAGTDYLAKAGTLSFPAGSTTQNVSITVVGDTLCEYNEQLYLKLSSGSAGTEIQDAIGLGTITNDDAFPMFSIAYAGPATLAEGAAGTTKTVPFTVTLSAASGRVTFVNYATADGTAQVTGALAAGGSDYVSTSDALRFEPGETVKTVNVTINGDATWETSETFSVALSGASSATISGPAGSATATIANDDGVPVASIANVAKKEGTPPPGGTMQTAITFTITLSNPSSATVSINARSIAGTACSVLGFTCTRPDFGALPLTTYTFAPGVTTVTFNVLIASDAFAESDETFTVPLSLPVGANASLSPSAATATATIVNDD